jgi:hypothetical protein
MGLYEFPEVFPLYSRSYYSPQWAGWLSRYSDWLRAERSGDRIPVGARFSAPGQTGPGAHQASCTVGTGSFPGVESGRGVTLTPHPLLVPRSKKKRSIAVPLLSLRVFVVYKKGETYCSPHMFTYPCSGWHWSASVLSA